MREMIVMAVVVAIAAMIGTTLVMRRMSTAGRFAIVNTRSYVFLIDRVSGTTWRRCSVPISNKPTREYKPTLENDIDIMKYMPIRTEDAWCLMRQLDRHPTTQ